MRPLRSAHLLEIWDRGADRHAVDRALVFLAFAYPELGWEDLCALPVGERNRLLLAARAATFGPRLDVVSRCPRCGAPVEFDFVAPITDLAPVSARRVEWALPQGGRLSVRLPDSRDLAAVASAPADEAQRCLVERCVTIEALGEPPAPSHADLTRCLSDVVEAHDPLAVIAFPLRCPACDQPWRATLDPIEYLWRELGQRVKVLVREVHVLARAYGWTEQVVLGLTPARRRLYLEQVGA